MDVYQTIDLWDIHYKFLNKSDNDLDGTMLYSDTGFVLNYKKQKGINEFNWLNALIDYNFDMEPVNMGRYLETDSPITELDIANLHMGKVYVLNFVFGRVWYGFAFDGKEFLMQNNNGNLYLPEIIFG